MLRPDAFNFDHFEARLATWENLGGLFYYRPHNLMEELPAHNGSAQDRYLVGAPNMIEKTEFVKQVRRPTAGHRSPKPGISVRIRADLPKTLCPSSSFGRALAL